LNALNNGEIPVPGGYGDASGLTTNQQIPNFDMNPAPMIPPTITPAPTNFAVSQPSVFEIPSAPTNSVFQPPPSTISYNQHAMQLSPPSSSQYPPQAYNPPANRPAPLNNADPRVKDSIELCNFAIAALKVN
jgi:hypothetical protein